MQTMRLLTECGHQVVAAETNDGEFIEIEDGKAYNLTSLIYWLSSQEESHTRVSFC